MPVYQQFLWFVGSIIGAIIGLKIFFSLWRLLEKKIHPDKFERIEKAPEVIFNNLKKKKINIFMKNGESINDCLYKKTLYFGDGELGFNAPIYFQVEDNNKKLIFISGADIWKIETTK